MWFKQETSLHDSNFGMENYSSLVDEKLLLKRILDGYWNKLLCKFCITVRRFHTRVQSSTCATYEKCNKGRRNSEIGYAIDCLNSFWDRQKAEFFMVYSFVGTIANIYLTEKKLCIVNWPIEGKKQYVFCQTIATHKNVYIVQIPIRKRSFDVSSGNLNMAMALYRYTSKRIAKQWWSKNVITSMRFEFTEFLFSFFR